MPPMLKVMVLWLGCASAAVAAVAVPLTLSPPPVLASGGADTQEASPARGPVQWAPSPPVSFLQPSLPDLPGTRLVLRSKPSQCPERFQWCDQGASGPLAPVQSLGAGVGVDLGGGLRLEYARGLVNHFNFLGLGTSFSP